MENKTLTTTILVTTSETGKTEFAGHRFEHAEMKPITYDEEAVKNEIKDKDIVILLLNEETKEEIEEFKKIATLGKELNKFMITFVSEQTAKEVQEELESKVDALAVIPRTLKKPTDDVMQAIQGFLQVVIEAGLFNIELNDLKVILNGQTAMQFHTHMGDIEEVVSKISSNEKIQKKLQDTTGVLCHLSMGKEGTYEMYDALADQIHTHIQLDTNIITGLKIEETLKGNDVVVTLVVA